MTFYPEQLKKQLIDIIATLSEQRKKYVINPLKDFTRTKKLSFEDMLLSIICMGGSTIQKELIEYFGIENDIPTSSAYVQRRSQIKPSVFKEIFLEFTNMCNHLDDFQGYRLIAVDGSRLMLPRNSKEKETFLNSITYQKGKNDLHINAFYDVINNIYTDIYVDKENHRREQFAMREMIKASSMENVILIADRGYESYNSMVTAERKGWKYLYRAKSKGNNTIIGPLNLPEKQEFDIDISYIMTYSQKKAIKENKIDYRYTAASAASFLYYEQGNPFYPIRYRVARFKIPNSEVYETVITNLDREEFPPDKLKNLYRKRWGIETSFRDMKYSLGLNYLHSKKIELIIQEVLGKAIAYNYTSMIVSHTTIEDKKRKYKYKVNYAKACRLCLIYLRISNNKPSNNIIKLLQKELVPIRDGRVFPRVKEKPKVKSFHYRVC